MAKKVKVKITVMEGRGFAAKDRNLLGQRTSSDPYVEVWSKQRNPVTDNLIDELMGKTPIIKKTLNPAWTTDNHFEFKVEGPKPVLKLKIMGGNFASDDDLMGVVMVPVPMEKSDSTRWYEVPKESAPNAEGTLCLRVQTVVLKKKNKAEGTSKKKKETTKRGNSPKGEKSPKQGKSLAPTDSDVSSTNKVNAARVGVSFEDLSYSVKIDKDETFTILKGLSGAFAPGRLVALMGPSGSGKSTLLDTLAGRKNSGNLLGSVLFNGKPPSRDDYRFTVGYVEQFDTLVGELTVENMLRYTADLKLPSSISAAEREARVEEVIQMLDLESCRKTVIGGTLSRGISGGQAKRVNIGLALVTRPPVLFLDEPTSGLDSRVADEVVELLRQLAHESNRTIVCTIHSPTGHAFSLFDELYMIHKGETIYDGPINKAQSYFENHGNTRDPDASLPEWLVDMTSDLESIQQRKSAALDEGTDNTGTTGRSGTRSSFVEIFRSSEMKTVADQSRRNLVEAYKGEPTTKSKKKSEHAPSELSRLVTLLKYRAVAHYKSAEFLGPRFGDKTIFALLILSLYYGIGEETDPQSIASVSSLLFFICALCGFGAAAFVPTLNLERKLFYRELADGCYSPTTYYFSKFIEEAVIALFTSALFCVIVFFGLKLTGNFGVFFLTYYLTTLIGVILAYAVSAAVPSLEAANALLPTYVTICLYFGGLFIVFDKIPQGWEWFSYTSFMRYSWGAFMLDNYRDSATSKVPVFFDANGNPQTVLEFYGMTEGPILDSIGACLGLLTLLLAVFTFLGVLALAYIRHEKR